MARRIAIVGAGISGLLACKYVSEKGFDPIVFEAKSRVGGVWTDTVESTLLQTPKDVYQFTDFPWPRSVKEEFPNHNQVLDYIESYARHFDVVRRIKFFSKVVSIDYDGPPDQEMAAWDLWGATGEPFSPKGKWNLKVEDTRSQSTEIYEVDFVVLCIGRFGDVPNIPDFPPNKGPEVFDGEVIHSMEYSAMDDASAAEYIKGKRIAVVGLQKSALDVAVECAVVNEAKNPCTLIYKTEHWNVPNYLPWGVPLGYFYCNRFAELMVHKPDEGVLLSLLATLLSPVRWGFSKFVESYIRWKLPMKKYKMIPPHSFHKEMNSCLISTVPSNLYDKIEEGSIILKKSTTFNFCKDGLMLDGETATLPIDLVILGTGYKGDIKLKNIFNSPNFQKYIMGSYTSTVPLYRECIHPRIPQLAVNGYSESLANLYTAEIRCRWLAELLDGTFKLPNIKVMEEDILKWEKYMKKYSEQYYRRSCVGVIHIWYNDQLCKDIGWNPKRKKGLLAELFQPYGPMDYANLSN